MAQRKKFTNIVDISNWVNIQEKLPGQYKTKVMISFSDGVPGAGAVCSAIGNTGIYLFGATNEVGMKDHGSYLIQWKMIEWMKEIGCKKYDLHGINKFTNPGTYSFKKGLTGKNGREYQFLGEYDACDLKYIYYLMMCADLMINRARKMKLLNQFARKIKEYFKEHRK